MLNDTIVALATARGSGALAVIRLSGPEACTIADRVVQPSGRVSRLASHHCALCRIADDGEAIDQAIVTVFRPPHSYTGEACVEFSCHGGVLTPSRVLDLLERQGARPAREGEFSLRAYLNGKMDLAQAEAVSALIEARSAAGARAALRVLKGGLGHILRPIMQAITEARARIEATLDFQEDGAADVIGPAATVEEELAESLRRQLGQLDALRAGNRRGRLLEDGIHVSLVGRPNVGKSSIFNAFLARDRAIVSPEPGTTRDCLEAWVEWDGLPVTLTDTAGLGDAASEVEREGMRRTHQAIAGSTAVILVVDVSETQDQNGLATRVEELGRAAETVVVALHKWDRGAVAGWSPSAEAIGAPTVRSSVVGEPGVDELRQAVLQQLALREEGLNAMAVVGERQRHLLVRSCDALRRALELQEGGAGGELVAHELREAHHPLGEILGERTDALVLEEVFSRFCVGK